MKKSIYTPEYSIVLEILRELRDEAGVSQIKLAEMLGQSQSFVSKIERGDRRLDIIQLRTICENLGTSLSEFVARLENHINSPRKRRKR